MTERQALIEARRRWGRTASIGKDAKALKGDERQALAESLQALRATYPLLEADSTEEGVRRYREARRVARELFSKIESRARWVGRYLPEIGAVMIEGTGDTWAEAFEDVEHRKAKLAGRA